MSKAEWVKLTVNIRKSTMKKLKLGAKSSKSTIKSFVDKTLANNL